MTMDARGNLECLYMMRRGKVVMQPRCFKYKNEKKEKNKMIKTNKLSKPCKLQTVPKGFLKSLMPVSCNKQALGPAESLKDLCSPLEKMLPLHIIGID